jgi:hypothetical protein
MMASAVDESDQFYKDISQDNSLSVVIRAAIHVEQEVNKLIRATVHDPKAFDRMDITYFQRMEFAVVLGLQPRFLSPLKALGMIRNKFAHQIRPDVTKSDADAFYASFSAEEKTIIQDVYSRQLKKGIYTTKRPTRMSDLDPLERFTLYAATLRSAIIVGRSQAGRLALSTGDQ